MKRYFLWFTLILIGIVLNTSNGEAAVTPKSDLKDYLQKVKVLEKGHYDSFQSALQQIRDIHLQPQTRKEILEKKLLPNLDSLLKDWGNINPQTPEVQEINQSYMKAYSTMREGLLLRSKAWELEQIESNLLTSGNVTQAKEFRAQINLEHSKASLKLNEASMQADTAMDVLYQLAKQNKVKIPELYLLSPGSTPKEK